MTSLNLLSQQKTDSDQEAEVSVQSVLSSCVLSRDSYPVFYLISIDFVHQWVGTKYVIRNRRRAILLEGTLSKRKK